MNTLIFGLVGFIVSIVFCSLAGYGFGTDSDYYRTPKSGSIITFICTSVACLIGLGIDIGKFLG